MLIDEVAQFLEANSLGIYTNDSGRNIFTGNLPDGVDIAICIYDTNGLASNIDVPLSHPSFQVMIRDLDLSNGENRTLAIRNLLNRFYNNTFITNGIYIYTCNLIAYGGHIGKDEKGRELYSLNFNLKIRDNNN